MKLYFSRNPNPRLSVATARFLGAPLELEFAAPFAPGQAEKFSKLNPNLSIPILEEAGQTLWEADAIACRLSRAMGSSFWRTGDAEPDMIRWLSWGKANFDHACDMVHFERGTKQRHAVGWLVTLHPTQIFEWRHFYPSMTSPVYHWAGSKRSAVGMPNSRKLRPGIALFKGLMFQNYQKFQVETLNFLRDGHLWRDKLSILVRSSGNICPLCGADRSD